MPVGTRSTFGTSLGIEHPSGMVAGFGHESKNGDVRDGDDLQQHEASFVAPPTDTSTQQGPAQGMSLKEALEEVEPFWP